MTRTLIVVACAVAGLSACGCILPYAAYPTLDRTPAVSLDAPKGEVRAFRVDISKPGADLNAYTEPVSEYLTELPVSHRDEVAAQYKTSGVFGLVIVGVALNYVTHFSESLELRLYRPGYETVEIKTWERASRVKWVPVPTVEAQIAALEKLFHPDRVGEPKTAAHRAALAFGADECNRLLAGADADQRVRLTRKAERLRKLVMEPEKK